MKQRIILVCWFLITVFGFSANDSASAATNYQFVYISIAKDQSKELIFIDPTNSSRLETRAMTLSESNTGNLYAVVPDPTGEWIALPVKTTNNALLYLYHLQTGDVRHVADANFALRDIQGAFDQHLAWSPDGHYLAFSVAPSDQESDLKGGIYVYSLISQELVALVQDLEFYSRLVWSQDSQKLAAFTRKCADSQSCEYTLLAFDLRTNRVLQSIQVPFLNLSASSEIAFDAICSLAWSPNGRYVSFVPMCSFESLPPEREVYVWDIENERLDPITSFTTNLEENSTEIFSGIYYSTIWVAPEIILVSAVWDSLPGIGIRTIAVNVTDKEITELSSEAIEAWALNPQSGQIAYRVVDSLSADSLIPANQELRLGEIDLGTTVKLESKQLITANICHLSWSPDGAVLAYAIIDITDRFGRNCWRRPISLGFVDATGQALSSLALPDDNEIDATILVGWVHNP